MTIRFPIRRCPEAEPRNNAAPALGKLRSPWVRTLTVHAATHALAAEARLKSLCDHGSRQDIHIFRAFPHMHTYGVRLSTTIERAAGGSDPLIDVPYDFNSQILYDTPAIVHPGDRLITQCYYNNTTTSHIVLSGERSTDEMCINFVFAWPARALSHPTLLSWTPGACAQ